MADEESKDLIKQATDEARAEWIKRGKDPVKFSLEAMTAIWEKEDVDEAKLANGLGLSRLRQKDDLIALEEEKTLVYQANKRIKVVSEKTKVVAKKVGKFLGETASGLADTLLPKYFKDRRNLKEYNQLQGKKTTNQRSLKAIHDRNVLKFQRAKAQLKLEAEARHKRLENEKPYKSLHAAAKEAYDRKIRNVEYEKVMKIRRERLKVRVQKRKAKELEALLSADISGKRAKEAIRLKKYAEKQVALSAQHNQVVVKVRNDQRVYDLEENKQEIADAQEQLRVSSLGDMPTSKDAFSNGIFGVPMVEGEFFDPAQRGGSREGNEMTVKIFSDTHEGVAYHRQLDRLHAREAEATRAENKVAHLRQEANFSVEESTSLEEMIGKLTSEIDTIDNAEANYKKVLKGPPGRLPNDSEKTASHQRKRMRFQLHRQRAKLQVRYDKVRESMTLGQREEADAQAKLRAVQATLARETAEFKLVDDNKPELPVVIGHGLHTGKKDTPAMSQAKIKLLSKVAIASDTGDGVLDVYKTLTVADRRIRQLRSDRRKAKQKLEEQLAKSYHVSKRIGKVFAEGKRRELMEALEKFLKSGLRLRVVGLGRIPLRWWKLKFDRTVEGVAQWTGESRGPKHPVLRGLRCKGLKGRVQGILSLPKFALYTVKFRVLKGGRVQGTRKDGDGGNPNDCITVRVGTNLESMQLLGVYKNVSPPGFSVVDYHIKYEHLGKVLAFSFEFVNSSKGDLAKQLVLTNGTIEEQKPPPIEDYIHPLTGERHTVSEFVHRLRLQSAVPKIRAIGLLEELDRLKDVPDERVVDSAVLHGSSQRFQRKVLNEMILRELEKEDAKSMKECKRLQEQRELWAKTPSSQLTKEERLQKKMMRAKLRYVRRKRMGAPPIDTSAAERICGKTLEYFDPDRKRWFFANVLKFKVMWLDMGTRMQLLHELRLMGGSTEDDDSIWVDLNASHYVVVPSNFLEVQLAREKVEAFEASRKQADDDAYVEFKKVEKKKARSNAKQMKKYRKEFEERMERLIPEGVAAAKVEARRRSTEDPDVNKKVKRAALQIADNSLVGRNKERESKYMTDEESFEAAQEVYVEKYARYQADELERQRRTETKLRTLAFANMAKRWQEEAKQRDDDFWKERERLREEADNKRKMEEQEEAKANQSLVIPNFSKAVLPSPGCDHPRVKYWKTSYDNGARCLTCGKEVSRLHYDPDQLHGIGIRPPHPLLEPDEMYYRMQKEKGQMELNEKIFYDYEVSKDMHKLNVTHELSEVGGNDTPRWRRTKRRHRGRFTDTMTFFFRIKQYHVSIQQLRDGHVKMRRERRELLTSLDVAHREVYKTEDLSLRMNREYSRAKGMRENRARVQKELDEATGELSKSRDQEATYKKRRDAASVAVREARKRYGSLKGQVQALLLLRMSARGKRDDTMKSLKDLKTRAKDFETRMPDMELAVVRRLYVQRNTIVLTTWGMATVLEYDAPTKLLKMKLRWGLRSKITMCLERVIKMERHRILAERSLMGMEDQNVCSFIGDERAQMGRELAQMAESERESIQFSDVIDLNTQQKELIQQRVEQIEHKIQLVFEKGDPALLATFARGSSQAKQFAALNEEADRRVTEIVKAREIEFQNWKKLGGPDKPERFKGKQIREMRNQHRQLIKMEYLETEQKKAADAISLHFQRKRETECKQRGLEHAFKALLAPLVEEAVQSLVEKNDVARENAEDITNLIFESPTDTGLLMYENWRQRAMLRRMTRFLMQKLLTAVGGEDRVALNARLAKEQDALQARMKTEWMQRGLPVEDFTVEKIQDIWAEEERQKDDELKREQKERRMMSEVDRECKQFYTLEVEQYMAERRLMAAEDAAMRDLMIKEAQVAAKEAYDTPGSNRGTAWNTIVKQIKRATIFSEKLVRVGFLKHRHAERLRAKREWPLMEAEDRLGFLMRADLMRAEGAKRSAIERSMDDDNDSDDDAGFEETFDFDAGDGFSKEMQITDSSCEEWISGSEYEWVTDDEADDVATLPKKYLRFFWFRSLVESLQASPAQRRRLLRTCDRVGMDANTTAIVLLKFDDEVNITRKSITDLLFAELELMGLHDQIPVDEKRLEVLKDNCLQIDKKTRAKSVKEVQLRRRLERRQKTLKEEDRVWNEKCEELEDSLEEWEEKVFQKQLVTKNTDYFDTDVVHNKMQRYKLDSIYDKLYILNFRTMVLNIAARAEVCGLERRMRHINEHLVINLKERMRRDRVIASMHRTRLRKERLCTKRSGLRLIFFAQTNRAFISAVFLAWKQTVVQTKRIKGAYGLRYTLLKQQKDIEALGKKKDTPEPEQKSRSYMHGLMLRKVRCENCSMHYMEAQNNQEACRYHPGEYIIECPHDCPYHGKQPAHSCMIHYRYRWSCCDATEDEPFMANGCHSRFHRPPGHNAKYAALVESEEKRREDKRQKELDSENEISSWLREVRGKRGSEMLSIMNTRHKQRDHLETYHSLATQGPFVGKRAVAKRNQQFTNQLWGPPPEMTFLAESYKKGQPTKKNESTNSSVRL